MKWNRRVKDFIPLFWEIIYISYMPCSALKLEFSFFFLDAGAISAHSAVNWSVKIDKCDYFIQINEDNIPLLSLTGSVAGSVYSFKIYDTKYEDKCEISGKISALEMAKMELVRHSFKNSSGEVCFLDNLTLKTDSDGGVFSYYVWFSGVSFRVTCESPSSVPDKCGKSKNFAETVLLSDNAFKCDSLGGKFDGGVYPQKSPDGTDEYCVSGTCSNLCDSAWHKSVVKEIKDSVCCGRMKLEPQTGNGKCTEPKAMDSTKIGVHFPEVKLGCSVTPAGGGVNYCEVPSSSSSSSFDDALSSSSYEDSESSSSGEGEGESDSEVDCFADVGMAASNLHSKIRRCEQEGGVSDFSEYSGCVYGSCLPPSSSSSGEQSSSSEEQSNSSSGDGESGVCSDGTQFLQKSEADLYDDWVYIGTETYGYRKARMRISDLRGMYFDALGRMSEKMQGSRFYFLKNSPIIEEWDEPLQFKVYAKTIADSVFGEVQAFIKEDEENGLRRDSTFYVSNGYWDVLEIKGDAEISLKNSLGITSKSIRDSEGKLQERTITDKEGNFIVYDKYIWKNGLLDKEISLEGTRTYHYGESPYTDTVRVEPSDKGHYFHRGYDGTAGAIPKKSDSKYKNFINDPYGIDIDIEKIFSINENKLNVLSKGGYNYPNLIEGMPIPQYKNSVFSDTLKPECRENVECRPINYNGRSNMNPVYAGEICSCKNGGWYADSYRIIIGKEASIELLQSFLRLDRNTLISGKGRKWVRRCLKEQEIDGTYRHEAKHHENSVNKLTLLANEYILPQVRHASKKECFDYARNNSTAAKVFYDEWAKQEYKHLNPESPRYSGNKHGEVCDEQ